MVIKSNTLKLSSFLAQFLYTNNELVLAGIGRFRMNSQAGEAEPGNSKNIPIADIVFEQNSTAKVDDSLVSFIAVQSGKMKSLAASDLDSYLELARQFLNIGKPFLIDGIGVLTKNKSGTLEFAPGYLLNEKLKANATASGDQTSSTEDSFTNYEEMLSPKKTKTPVSKRLVLWLTILAGIALAVWGGYILYSKTKKSETPVQTTTVPVQQNDNTVVIKTDSSAIQSKETFTTAGEYKFVIENANRARAFTRYNYLKKWGINIYMETKDSVIFKLYFKLAALPADTTRIKDSLTNLYGSMDRATIDQ